MAGVTQDHSAIAEAIRARLYQFAPSGQLKRHAVEKILQYLGSSASESGALLAFFGTGEEVNIDAFIDFFFGANREAPTRRVVGSSIGCWNIRSPDLSGNCFEMYAGDGMIVEPKQEELMRMLILKADAMILSEASQTLEDILPDDLPLKVFDDPKRAGSLEMAPLNVAHKEPMMKFFAPRLSTEISDDRLSTFVDKWLSDPTERWKYWKAQKARDFIADDGSGGKSSINSIMAPAPEPILDCVAWDLGLGVADQKYHFCDTRIDRVKWLYPKDSTPENAKYPESGKHDLFKLLVWDLVLEAVRDRARSDWPEGVEHWDRTFEALISSLSQTPSIEEHVEKVAKMVIDGGSPDILVLVEANSTILEGENPKIVQKISSLQAGSEARYSLLRPAPEHMDQTSNVAILVKQGLFEKVEVEPFVDAENRLLGRAIGAVLTDVSGQALQILAMHLPSNGYNIPAVCGEVDKRLEKPMPSIVLGDLNLDLRTEKARKKFVKDRPSLAKLVEISKHTWDHPMDRGSVNKRRTAFQAQVSKINLEDFAIKDSILVSEPGLGEISGLISRREQLPSVHCPSDHVLLCWNSPRWPTAFSSD